MVSNSVRTRGLIRWVAATHSRVVAVEEASNCFSVARLAGADDVRGSARSGEDHRPKMAITSRTSHGSTSVGACQSSEHRAGIAPVRTTAPTPKQRRRVKRVLWR